MIPNPSTRLRKSSNLFSLSTEMHSKLKDWQYPARTSALLLRLVFGRKRILGKGDLFPPKLSFLSIHTLTRSILWIYTPNTTVKWGTEEQHPLFGNNKRWRRNCIFSIPKSLSKDEEDKQADNSSAVSSSAALASQKVSSYDVSDPRLCCALNPLLPTSGNFVVLAVPILTLRHQCLWIGMNEWTKFCSHFLRHMHLRDIYWPK